MGASQHNRGPCSNLCKYSLRVKAPVYLSGSMDSSKQLPSVFGNSALRRVLFVFSLVYEDTYGVRPVINNWGKIGKLFTPLLAEFGEYAVAAVLTCYVYDTDLFVSEKGHPLALVPSRINQYLLELLDEDGIDVKDTATVKTFLQFQLRNLSTYKNFVASVKQGTMKNV